MDTALVRVQANDGSTVEIQIFGSSSARPESRDTHQVVLGKVDAQRAKAFVDLARQLLKIANPVLAHEGREFRVDSFGHPEGLAK
ncbi:MAG: hypothetical protein WCT40_03905 [Candidatus Magasanikbacteria bacterium]|jgi:hypothetical protein